MREPNSIDVNKCIAFINIYRFLPWDLRDANDDIELTLQFWESVSAELQEYFMVRYLPLIVGVFGGIGLLANRMVTVNLTSSQSRADALGILLSAVLILIGLLWQQIQPKPPDAVTLLGEELFEIDQSLPDNLRTDIAWASHILLTNTVTRAIAIYYDQKTILRRGILSKNPVKIGPIAERVMKTQKPVYLVKLELYPGRIEFDYFPENTQGLIVQPFGKKGFMVLGANVPRSYTKQDENWITAIADKLSYNLEQSTLVPQQEL